MYYIYQIKINGDVRYIGYTNNPKRRFTQHKKSLEIGDKKYLYKKIRELIEPSLEWEIIATFENSGDAKRWEAYLILQDYFTNKSLWQSFPVSFKYF
jgi:predicted GIY-YIG superfamily endonuclease